MSHGVTAQTAARPVRREERESSTTERAEPDPLMQTPCPAGPAPTDAGEDALRGERAVGAVTRLKFELVRSFLALWARCFSLSGLYALGQFFGTCEYLVDIRRRRRVGARLRQIFPEGLPLVRRQRITWRYFRRIRCDKMIYLILDKLPREKLLRRIRWSGREHLDAALRRNRGAYIMLSHYGSHHVAGFMMALLGYRLAGVRDPKEAALRRYVQQKFAETLPEAAAMRMFYADTFPRAIYREFRENRTVCTALDVDRFRGERLRTCPVTIFGQRKEFLTGTLQIALRVGAPVMQAFMLSRRNYYYRWELSAPLLDPGVQQDDPDTVARIMQTYADNIERHAHTHPCHLMKI